MKNSILIQTLQAFSTSELNGLGRFLESPFFNSGSHSNQIIILFNYLKKNIENNHLDNFDKSLITSELFSKKQINNNRNLENRMSELMAITRKYITWLQINKNWKNTFEGIICAQFYKERGIEKLQELSIIKSRKLASKNQLFLDKNPILRFWLEEGVFNLENLRNKRKGDLNISNTIESLSIHYSIKLLEISLAQTQQERVVQTYKPKWKNLVKDIRVLLPSYNYFNNPTILLLNEALVLIEDQSENSFQQLQNFVNLLNQNKENIPIRITKNLAAYARNFCTQKINEGNSEYYNFRLLLYKKHLRDGWLYEDHKLIPSSFINMINIGLWSNEKEWVENLLFKYGDMIAGNNKGRIINYGFTLYYSYIQDIENARIYLNKLLQSKKFRDNYMENMVRVLELKILFEENDNFIYSQLHNYLMFVRRSKKTLSQNDSQRKINFIKVLKKMMKLKELVNNKSNIKFFNQVIDLEEKLKNPLPPTDERHWLLIKVKELKLIYN